MSEYVKIASIDVNKMPLIEPVQQVHSHNNSNKLLSPFTWSNLNIKLPKVHKPTANYLTIQEHPTSNRRKLHGRSELKGNQKLETGDQQQKRQPQNNKIADIKQRYRKQSIEAADKSANLNMPEGNALPNPEKFSQLKRDLITRQLQKSMQRNQSPKQRSVNKTSFDFSRIRSPVLYGGKSNSICTPQTFSYNKIETYQYKALIKSNWCEVSLKDQAILPELVWSDHFLEQARLTKGQLHNHMQNAHWLTTKSSLHELQSAHGCDHYPQSFIMPFQYQNFCEEYEQQVVKICLKDLMKNSYSRLNQGKKSDKNLGVILQEIKSNKTMVNQDNMMALRLCLYLEQYRKSKNYRYFEHSDQYVPMQARLQQSVLSTLLKACFDYWQNLVKAGHTQTCPYFKLTNIDAELLWVLWDYHCMLLKLEPPYQTIATRNMWIVKPIASSRGAGISLLKNSAQFLSINHDRFQVSNKAKFSNKIIQKYIEEPLLLKQAKDYSDRKFDIRQWVLLTRDQESSSPLVYIYEDAYCRFSDMKFTFNHYRSDEAKIHLTNYSVSDKSNPESSLLLLSELFRDRLPNLQQVYHEQINKIVVETVMNANQIRFQPNRFQLLGYDVIFDSNLKLWLLEINQNPACEAARSPKLEKMADKMVSNMMTIVKAANGKAILDTKTRVSLGWRLAYGKENFDQIALSDQDMSTQIKPFYSVSLGSQSLVQEVRRRNFMMNAIIKNVLNFNQRIFWKKLQQHLEEPQPHSQGLEPHEKNEQNIQ